jgi:hypothetical protein
MEISSRGQEAHAIVHIYISYTHHKESSNRDSGKLGVKGLQFEGMNLMKYAIRFFKPGLFAHSLEELMSDFLNH